MLNQDGTTERAVPTTLQFRVPSTGGAPCSASSFVGDFNGTGQPPPKQPARLYSDFPGVDCAVVFSGSPISTKPHAIFQLKLPLLVTANTDPAYLSTEFISPYSDLFFTPVAPLSPLVSSAFLDQELGSMPTSTSHILGASEIQRSCPIRGSPLQ